MNKLLHTPEGVRDIYNEEFKKRQYLEKQMLDVIKSFGYENIQTPTFEFFDIFGKEIGTLSAKNLYKFFDREGNTLVLRPDFTPSVARAAAKYFASDYSAPIRLSYFGNVFLNNSNYQGRLKESTQLGCELIGDDTLDADAEIISAACGCLSSVGLKDFKISIGHSSIFGGLVEAAKFNDEEVEELKELILNKNFFGVEEFIDTKNLDDKLRSLFSILKQFYSSPDEWKELGEKAKAYPKVYDALVYFEKLYELLETYGVSDYISFEMGLISQFQYYTGVVFSGYSYGSGEPIVKGGRYDRLLSNFGKDAPAIGFAVLVDQLQLAIDRQKISIPIDKNKDVILYKKEDRQKAIAKAKTYRDYGKIVQMIRILDLSEVEKYKEIFSDYYVEVIED
ncbi:MAG: ATP phosphoribosyltransferase regulatory subunit [Lachnospiraceae bacterium]|nr:ATP phosphoribosyltransferase regulatory subunit [Lachnospiraceae bacterium]